MSGTLLDVNVLVALAWPNHVHHDAAHRWFSHDSSRRWATSSITELGFIRVSSNRRVIPDARSPHEALLLLRDITAVRGHVFWIDDVSPVMFEGFPSEGLVGHHQITDAHLVALAIRHRGRVATFDDGLHALARAAGRSAELVVTIPSRPR